jgi:hypothetical protein
MELPLDKYTYEARLLPALITLAPLSFGVAAWSFSERAAWKVFVGIVVSLGLATLLAQLSRDLGKRKEPVLFVQWGGKPTTKLLSHRFSSLNPITLRRYHAKLAELLPDLQIPQHAEEMRSPTEAAQVYDSCALYLRENTRDRKKFPLVFAENVNYGFRRNLWAWKPIGIISSAVGACSSVLFILIRLGGGRSELIFDAAGGAMSLGLLLLWLFRFKPEWVRLAGQAYAERLIGSVDSLGASREG